jgi:hypothetical protein
MLYAPYLVFRSQIRRKDMQNGQIGYGIALRRFRGLRVNVLQPFGARRFNIVSSRTVILVVLVLLFRGVDGYGLITRIKSGLRITLKLLSPCFKSCLSKRRTLLDVIIMGTRIASQFQV